MMTDAPIARSARIDVLVTGSPGPACASTCSLVRDEPADLICRGTGAVPPDGRDAPVAAYPASHA